MFEETYLESSRFCKQYAERLIEVDDYDGENERLSRGKSESLIRNLWGIHAILALYI